MPLLAGLKYAQELNIEASLRYSDINTENGYTGAEQIHLVQHIVLKLGIDL